MQIACRFAIKVQLEQLECLGTNIDCFFSSEAPESEPAPIWLPCIREKISPRLTEARAPLMHLSTTRATYRDRMRWHLRCFSSTGYAAKITNRFTRAHARSAMVESSL